MRILVVNKYYWIKGGSERVAFDLARCYREAGHEVIPFAMAGEDNLPSPWSQYFAPAVDWDRAGPIQRLRHAAGVIHSHEAARCLRALLRAARPDVAHLHNFHHQLSPSIVDVLRAEEVPAVHTLHDYKVVCPNYLLHTSGAVCERCAKGRFINAVRHRCVRGSRAASLVATLEMTWHGVRRTLPRGIGTFVAPSRFLADKVAAMGFPAGALRVVPNGVDVDRFSAREGSGDGFLYAGRLAREKGVQTLLTAVAQRPQARLTVVGSGPEEAELRTMAASLAPDRIRFVGYLQQDDLWAAMKDARALILPSEWYENAPMIVLEAGACGVPVIGARIGGIPELIEDGVTGLLFEPGSADSLAEQLAALEEDAELALRCGRAARRRVEERYSLRDQARTMLDILQESPPCASP